VTCVKKGWADFSNCRCPLDKFYRWASQGVRALDFYTGSGLEITVLVDAVWIFIDKIQGNSTCLTIVEWGGFTEFYEPEGQVGCEVGLEG
jgi:hypothetical protein